MNPRRAGLTARRPLLALTAMEWLMGWRSGGFRFVFVAAFVFGCTTGASAGRGVGLSAYGTAEAAWQYLSFVCVIWVAIAAVRETTLRTNILIFCKPQPSENLALVKFAGALMQVFAFLTAMFLGAVCGRLFSGEGLAGFEVYVPQFLRAAVVLFFTATASFSLALLFDSAITGSIIGLYVILTLAGKAYLGKFYFPAYAQNQAAYVALSVAILLITLRLYGRSRRGGVRPAIWVRAGVPVCLLLSAWFFWVVVRDGHDPQARLNPALLRMEEQDAAPGLRAPGFLLPDQYGHATELSDYTGKIMVIALWSPQDPDSVLLLDRLNELQARYGARGVQVVAICLGEDNGAASTFARGEGLNYPVVDDWGTTSLTDRSGISPLANAYRTTSLPKLVITDRRRLIRVELVGSDAYDGSGVEAHIADRLAAEPN